MLPNATSQTLIISESRHLRQNTGNCLKTVGGLDSGTTSRVAMMIHLGIKWGKSEITDESPLCRIILSVISFLPFRLVTRSSLIERREQTLAERNSDTAERREGERTSETRANIWWQGSRKLNPLIDRNMIQGKMSYLQEINKDDQLDNWIIFGTVETFLFFTFPISSVVPLTDSRLPTLTVSEIWPALAPIWGWHLARPPRSGGQIVSRRIHIINRDYIQE